MFVDGGLVDCPVGICWGRGAVSLRLNEMEVVIDTQARFCACTGTMWIDGMLVEKVEG